jgi:hypothetical protein
MLTLLVGIAMALAAGGLYILYLAFFRPQIFAKPKRAKIEGAIAFVLGVIVLLLYYKPWQ